MTPVAQIDVFAAYRQVAVFDPALTSPLNSWMGEHVRQGFSWRPGSVSFSTLVDGGPVRIRVEQTDALYIPDGAVRAIVVPFVVTGDALKVGGLFDAAVCPLPAGTYDLLFAVVPPTHTTPETCYLRFVASANSYPRHLRVDEQLDPPVPLFMEADPA